MIVTRTDIVVVVITGGPTMEAWRLGWIACFHALSLECGEIFTFKAV